MRMRMRKRIVAMVVILSLVATILPVVPAKTNKAAGYGLSNPRIVDEVSTWDCIYFGNYWQEDTNGDGTADQNDEKTPIKWRVLSVDGDDAFLLADKNLDAQPYNNTLTDVTWETCTLRSWLNDDFMNVAFTSSERSAIPSVTVINEDNPQYGTEGGNDTQDKIYLLSISEAKNESYGFTEKFMLTDYLSRAREGVNTTYLNYALYDCIPDGGEGGNGSCFGTWWLRIPAQSQRDACVVLGNGSCDYYWNNRVNSDYTVVRPALHINLSSTSNWSYAGTVSSNGESAPPVNGAITVQTPLKDSISTRELFEDYPGYLYESPQEKVIEMILEECEEVNGNRTLAQNFLASYKYMLSGEAIESILKFRASQFGATSIQDEYLDEATLRLLEGMTQQTDVIEKTIKEVKDDYKWAKDLKSVTKEISSMEMQQLLAKSGHYNEKEIELLMKEIGTNWEDIDKIFKNVGYAIDFNEAALLITTLESIEKSLIEDLLEEVKKAAPGSDVERGLTRALKNVSHPYKTVVSKYLKKDCLKVIAKAVEKKGESLVELVVGTGSTGLIFCAESVCKIIAHVLPEASADDVINAQNDTNFFQVMSICVSQKAIEFIYNKQNDGNLDIDKEIKNYKLLYRAKLVAAKNACESCEKIAKGYMKNVMGNNGVLLDTFSYKKHIKGCKAKVNAMLNAKYTYKKSDDNLSVSGLAENETSTMSLNSADDEDELEETDDVIDNSVLVIPSITEEMPVVSVADNAFEGNTEIEYVIVPDGVEEIGASAFKNCTSLKRVILGNSVTRIGEEAFAGCSSLEIIMCPDSLQQIEANSIEGANVTVMGSQSSAIIEYATANNISYVETEKEVSNISISKMPTKIEYSAGEKLDETGMELSVSYKDGTEATVTEGWYSFVFQNANGDVKVHVTYGGVSAEYEISLLSEQGYYEVLCQDENGVDVADSVTYTAVVGDTIQVQAPSVSGYELTSKETTKSILIGEDSTKVIFEYCRSSANNLKNATLSMATNSFEYTGSEIVPIISITLNGKELVEGTDYEKMVLNNVDVGTAVMIISGLEDYDGIYMKEYEIVSKEVSVPEVTPSPVPNQTVAESPQAPAVTPNVTPSVTADKASALSKIKGLSVTNKKKKQVALKWKKLSSAKGYQIQYATNKKFKKAKAKTTTKTKYTIKKLKKKKTYYIRVRAYKVINGKKVYGKWSSVKKVKVKK